MSDLSSDELVILEPSGRRECVACGRGWYGGYEHCCRCVQAQIQNLQRELAESNRLRALANEACDMAQRRVTHLEQSIRVMEREFREELRDAVAEERRSLSTGDPYGTY